jgi:hypothetical protein
MIFRLSPFHARKRALRARGYQSRKRVRVVTRVEITSVCRTFHTLGRLSEQVARPGFRRWRPHCGVKATQLIPRRQGSSVIA